MNRGIFDAFDHGIVTSASLMVRGEAAAGAVAGAAPRTGLALGLHLDLGEWRYGDTGWELAYEIVNAEDVGAVEAEIAHQPALSPAQDAPAGSFEVFVVDDQVAGATRRSAGAL